MNDDTTNRPSTMTDEPVRTRLRRRLLGLSYRAYLECLCVLLAKSGYQDVRPAGRADWKGFNRPGGGGYDIQAVLPGGVGRRTVVVQAKQFDALPVFQRSVDEMRGVCLRAGAAEALLVTISAFSSVVRRAPASAPVAPVRLLDGDGLIDLMLVHRVGVWEEAGEAESEPSRTEVDEGFFDGLAAAFPLRRREPGLPRAQKPAPAWTVTVSVGVDPAPVMPTMERW